MRFGDKAELWNTSPGAIQPNDKLYDKNPVKQIEFGVLLARMAHHGLINTEFGEPNEDQQEEGSSDKDDSMGED